MSSSFPSSRSRALAALALLALLATCRARDPAPRDARTTQAVPRDIAVGPPLPAVAPVEYRPVTVEQAREINDAPDIVEHAGPAARAFAAGAGRTAAVDCLTSAIYYEAASESDDGERAVAQVVLNRVRHPAFPASVCGVVYQGAERSTGCQFTFACDGALLRTPSVTGWARARRIATAALGGYVFAPVGNATHYHADWVVPYWASSLDRAATIGAHIFYRWTGSWGTPRAFFQHYAGIEPDMRAAIARWSQPGAVAPPVLGSPVLLEDAKVLATRSALRAKPTTVLVADVEASALVAPLRRAPRLEADRHRSPLKLDAH